MLITATIAEKHMGAKLLFRDLKFSIAERSKTGLIGRNGIGKSTLFGLLTGEDTDYQGQVERSKGLRIVATAQEHFRVDHLTPVEYVLTHAPDYYALKEIVDTYPDTMGQDMDKIQTYTEAVETFVARDYYTIEEDVVAALARLEIDLDAAFRPLGTLSGGQKRFVELVKLSFAQPDLILLDEPTNHLDYHGKALFLDWLRGLRVACCIISHDRDVLAEVDSIVEIRDYQAHTYPGNYDSYIRQNGTNTITEVNQYEAALKRLKVVHAQLQVANARKAGAGDSRPRILADRLQREYDRLKENLVKPSFWIDRQTTESLGKDTVESYEKYKAKTITIGTTAKDRYTRELVTVRNLSIGYTEPLFASLNFRIEHGDRLVLRGRNGAGKSTLVRSLLAAAQGTPPGVTIYAGEMAVHTGVRIGVYEQEIDPKYLDQPLGEAIATVYSEAGVFLDDRKLHGVLARYLFESTQDKQLPIRHLSGGQKARFQLIRMLCNEPNLLILDEPTNHLDLPSIEELENALVAFPGAVICISHDGHFIDRIGGETIQVGRE